MGSTAINRRRALRALYAQVPGIACKGLCADSCGPIDMSVTERAVIRREHHVEITPKVIAVSRLVHDSDFDCDALVDGRCSVYADRPMICRLWGVTETLRCPHGCQAEAVLSDEEGFLLVSESLRTGGLPDGEVLASEQELRTAYARPEVREVVDRMLRVSRPTA